MVRLAAWHLPVGPVDPPGRWAATSKCNINFILSRPFVFMATVANGAVRLSIGLRLVGFIHVFQKGDANGHHKVESVAKIINFE